MKNQTTSVVLAGVGGQGSLLAGIIVSEAALHAGYQVKTNEVHGMAQRGGSVITHIRYGREVFSPIAPVGTARAVGAFEMVEALRYAHYLAPDGLAVVSRHRVIPVTVSSGTTTYPADIEVRLRRTFKQLKLVEAEAIAGQLGNHRAANVVILGALSRGLEIPKDAWHAAIAIAVKPNYRDLNIRAFDAGHTWEA